MRRLFEMGFTRFGGNALDIPFSTSFGLANALFAISYVFGLASFSGRRRELMASDDIAGPIDLGLALELVVPVS